VQPIKECSGSEGLAPLVLDLDDSWQ